MDTTLTVPGGLVRDFRRGLYGEWGSTAEEISDLALRRASKSNKMLYERLCVKFDVGRALLNTVGWKDSRLQGDVEIDLSLHPTLVLSALRYAHMALVDQLREVPLDRKNHDIFSARIQALGDFIEVAGKQVRRLYREAKVRSGVSVQPKQTPRTRPALGQG